MLASRPEDLSVLPRTHVIEAENQLRYAAL